MKKPQIIVVTNNPESVRIVRPGRHMRGIRAEEVFVADDVEPHGRSAAEVARLTDWYEKDLLRSMKRGGRAYGWKP